MNSYEEAFVWMIQSTGRGLVALWKRIVTGRKTNSPSVEIEISPYDFLSPLAAAAEDKQKEEWQEEKRRRYATMGWPPGPPNSYGLGQAGVVGGQYRQQSPSPGYINILGHPSGQFDWANTASYVGSDLIYINNTQERENHRRVIDSIMNSNGKQGWAVSMPECTYWEGEEDGEGRTIDPYIEGSRPHYFSDGENDLGDYQTPGPGC